MPQRPDLEEFHKQLAETIQKESQKILDVRQELLKNYPMLDSDGYPTDECLQIIKNWHWSDPKGWFNFIKEHWCDERMQYSDEELDKMYPFDPVEDNPWSEEDLKALKNQ